MKILVVEDEKLISNAICKILTDEAYITDAVYNGEDAIYYASHETYDLIILDIMLPVINGTEVLKKIRELKINTPVLMLTAKNTIEDKVENLKLGADDYMTKPFDMRELLARTSALTRRSGNLAINKIDYGDLSLDLNSCVLVCGEKSISLTKKEFEVVKMMFKNSKMTIAKELLISNIWGINSQAGENSVEAYISFIRKKLRYLGSNVKIKNLQNIGYRLEVSEND